MSDIKKLSDKVIDQIAAGEIIERPSSVVKELVENAIDAGATRIRIEIEQGGKKLIQIADNGKGMNKEDLSMCYQRFATSKIKQTDDLQQIITYGFRGEAISSIASVSKMNILTKKQSEENAYSVLISGSKAYEIQDAVLEQGTVIKVEDLFFNVPARKKFLKKDMTEKRRILVWIEAISLANPFISFKLIADGKKIFATSVRKNLYDRMIEIYGTNFISDTSLLDLSFPDGEIKGFISDPDNCRRDRSGIRTFVNGRLVNNKSLNFAVLQFYRDKLHHGNYPYVLLILEIDSSLLDVNVHPAKQEIRFIDENGVISNILKAFSKAYANKIDQQYRTAETESSDFPLNEFDQKKEIPASLEGVRAKLFNDTQFTTCDRRDKYRPQINCIAEHQFTDHSGSLIAEDKMVEGTKVKLIGQLKDNYLIIELEDGVGILDQHASHERVLYEKTVKESESSKIQSQVLLIPETYEFSLDDFSIFKENFEQLNKLGFTISFFGTTTIKVDAVPQKIAGKNLTKYFPALVAFLRNPLYGKPGMDKLIRGVCRQSVMFGDKLSFIEQKQLISSLFKCENPFSCPHGRPTIFKITFDQINRKLGR